MSAKNRWYVAGTVGFPLLTITAYLLWLWPWPPGASVWAQTSPYLFSLLTGLPFAWLAARGAGRRWVLLAYFVGGFVFLWTYALGVLCGVRGSCL